MTLKEKFEQYAKEEIWRTRNYNAEECELIADDFAIGFAEWSVAKAMGFDSFKLNDGELKMYKIEKGL
jgi:hypothetical protein